MSDTKPQPNKSSVPNHQNIGLDKIHAEVPKAANVPQPPKSKK